jgi:hypothetical protein
MVTSMALEFVSNCVFVSALSSNAEVLIGGKMCKEHTNEPITVGNCNILLHARPWFRISLYLLIL